MTETNRGAYLEVRNLKKYFQTSRGMLYAVDDVSFSITRGETLGLVGESGCGKSTLGRCLLRLIEPTFGEVRYDGLDLLRLPPPAMRRMREKIQIVFQDPYSCLNPRLSVFDLIAEPPVVNKVHSSRKGTRDRVLELMDLVGLARRLVTSYPHELDGGRRKRIGIARSLAMNPEFIVLDEPVSALDVCVQAQVLNLLDSLQKQFGYTYIFISHNLSVVKHVSDRIAVMYLGKIVELCDYREMFTHPLHPYTRALLSAIPVARMDYCREHIILEGDVPSPIEPGKACRFAGRCRHRFDACENAPELAERRSGHWVACHLYADGAPGKHEQA